MSSGREETWLLCLGSLIDKRRIKTERRWQGIFSVYNDERRRHRTGSFMVYLMTVVRKVIGDFGEELVVGYLVSYFEKE